MFQRDAEPRPMIFGPSGAVPNSTLPVLVYRVDLPSDRNDSAACFERLFGRNGWSNGWRNGVYPFHHYHSTAHEVLGIAYGRAKLRLGGEDGRNVDVEAGDVLLLPAGTGHKRLDASADFLVVGAYPNGAGYDLIRAEQASAAETAAARRRIADVPRPDRDPVTGRAIQLWERS